MTGNKQRHMRWRTPLAWLLALCFIGDVQASENSSVSRQDAEAFFRQYQSVLAEQATDRLTALIAEDAELRIALQQPDNEPDQLFTLPRHRFVQHRRTLWHFGREVRQQFDTPRYTPQPDGTLMLQVTETERHRLFGQDTGQRNEITLTLGRRDGDIVILTLHSNSQLW